MRLTGEMLAERRTCMNLETLKKRKKELRLTNKDVARLSGVSLGTVNKIFSGATKAPQVDTMQAILGVLKLEEYEFYDGKMEREPLRAERIKGSFPGRLREPQMTAEDYRMLDKRKQTELIEGKLIRHQSPSWNHQELISGVLCNVRNYIREKGYGCHAICGPIEVQLECVNGDTIVQPDLVMLLGEEQIGLRGLLRAPEFVMEVLSESEQEQEMVVKPDLYMGAGVQEYWLVNLYQRQVIVYWFGNNYGREGFQVDTYTFDQKVPMRLLDGFMMDFGTIDLM